MNSEESKYSEGAFEPVHQRLHRSETGSTGGIARELTERPPITPELRERYDKEVVALGRLLNGAGAWWQLDGAMNVSLLQKEKGGDYIGMHADIDASVRRDELPRLEEYLKEKGYGLFLRTKDEEWRNWRRVGAEAFEIEKGVSPHFVAIDEEGVIRKDSELTKIEVSVIDFDAEGFPVANQVRYPAE